MLKNKQRIIPKNSENIKFTRKLKLFLISLLGKIFNSNNINTKDMFIIPGHYQTKNSLNNESAVIVRVLNVNPLNEFEWITDEGVKHESDLLNNYVLLETSYKEPSKIQTKKLNIGFEVNEIIGTETESTSQIIQKDTVQTNYVHIEQPVHNISFDNNKFFDSLQNKATSTKNSVNISFQLDIDVNKLHILCDTVDVEITEISKYISTKLMSDVNFHKKLTNSIIAQLINPTEVSEVFVKPSIEPNNNIDDILRNILDIKESITNIDNVMSIFSQQKTPDKKISDVNDERIQLLTKKLDKKLFQ